jgi:hypothetical protein
VAPISRRHRLKGAALQEWLPSQLQNNHDLTVQEQRQAFEEEVGVSVSASTVSRAIARLSEGAWWSKKVQASPRARRGGQGPVTVAGFPSSQAVVDAYKAFAADPYFKAPRGQ